LIFDGSPTTLPSGADGLEGPPPTKFYELRDNLATIGVGASGPVGSETNAPPDPLVGERERGEREEPQGDECLNGPCPRAGYSEI